MLSLGGADLHKSGELIEPYTSKLADKIAPSFRVNSHWTPFSTTTCAIVVNTEEVPADELPKSWADLTDAKWKGKIGSTRADQSGNAFQALATVLSTTPDEEAAWKVYGGLLANFIFMESAGEVARTVNDGEVPVGITLEDNALDYLNGGGPITIVYAAEGTSIVPDGMALVKNAPHPEEGKALIDWMLGDEAQRYIVEGVGRRSVLEASPAAPKGGRPTSEIKQVVYDFDRIGAKSGEWIERWKKLRAEVQD
jgi:iron(III) transport system substrate-binding protein